MIDEERRKPTPLTLFLRKCRSRISPHAVGLPPGKARRRRPGLRRDEVAELLDVTPNWYALFESGTSGRRFSRTFLARLMDVLALDEGERDRLERLAIGCGSVRQEGATEPDAQRLAAIVGAVAMMSRALAREPDTARACAIAVATLREMLPASEARFTIFLKATEALGRVRGPVAPTLPALVFASFDSHVPLVPAARSALAVPLELDEEIHGIIHIDSPEPDAFSACDAAIAKTIATQLALVLAAA